MLEFQTAHSIFATILMQEPAPVAVLLVEGPDDDALLGDHLAVGVLGITCGGRKTVVESTKIAQDAGWLNVFGLVDRDLVPELLGDENLPESVVTTTSYDLTADVARAKPGIIGRAVVAHAATASRVVRSARREDIEASVLDLATRYAGVRIAIAEQHHPVVLDGFDFQLVLGPDFETLDADAFTSALRVKEATYTFSDEAREHIAVRISRAAGVRELSGGHDIASAAYGLVTKAGARQVNKSVIERTIRAFADCALLSEIPCIVRLQELCVTATKSSMFTCFD